MQGAVEDGDGRVLSVYVGWPEGDENDTDVIRRVCEKAGIPHGVVQVGRTSRLQAAAFIDCLDEPIPNPTGGKRRPS